MCPMHIYLLIQFFCVAQLEGLIAQTKNKSAGLNHVTN